MGTETGLHPRKDTVEVPIPAAAQAAGSATVAARAPFTGVVSAVRYVPVAAIVGADDDTRRLAVVNRGQAGLGAVEIAALQFDDDVDAAAFDERQLTLSAVAANRDVVKGDVVEFRSSAVGAGLADPGGLAVIEFTRD